MDVDAQKTIKTMIPNAAALRYITTASSQRLFATANNGFVYAADHAFTLIARSEMLDQLWSPIYLCKNISPQLNEVTKEYVEANLKWVEYHGDHCADAGKSFVFSIHDNHISSGMEYTYKFMDTSTGESIDITSLLLKVLRNQDPEAPAEDAELGAISMIVTRASIGVQIKAVTAEIAERLGLKSTQGALVAEPQIDGPAVKAGIQAGDVIMAVNGAPIKDGNDLGRQIGSMSPGAAVELTVFQTGQEKTITLTLGELPDKDKVFAVSYNREVFVFSRDKILLRTKLSNAPSITKLLSKNLLVVAQKTNRGQKLTLFKLNREPFALTQLSASDKDKLSPLHNGSCTGYTRVFPKQAVLPNGSKIVFDIHTPTSSEGTSTIKVLNRDGDFKLIDLTSIDPDCVQVNSDFSYLLIKKDRHVDVYDLKLVLTKASLDGVEKQSLADSSLSLSAFFIGATDQVVTSHWNNRVLLWRRTSDGYVSEEIFAGDHPIKYAEPSRDGNRLLMIEDWGDGEVDGLLYSLSAQSKWMDIVENYKWIGLAFTSQEGIVFGSSNWEDKNSNFMTIKKLSELVSDAKNLVSRSCLSVSDEDYTKSTCWPDLTTE